MDHLFPEFSNSHYIKAINDALISALASAMGHRVIKAVATAVEFTDLEYLNSFIFFFII